jgi:hypothetical protein
MANMKKPGAKTSKSTTRGLGPAQKPVSPKTPIFANRAKSTNVASKKLAPMPRATKRGTPVPMPKMPGKGPMARMAERVTMSKPKPKVTKKPSKPVTERQLLDVKNMTPAEKMAYIKRGKRGF